MKTFTKGDDGKGIQMEVKSRIKGSNFFTLTDRDTGNRKGLLSLPLTVDYLELHI